MAVRDYYSFISRLIHTLRKQDMQNIEEGKLNEGRNFAGTQAYFV